MSPRTQSNTKPRASATDASLITQCVNDADAEAFEELMSRYHGKVYGVIMRQVRDVERAKDLTQETFLKAWSALARFEGTSGFYTWIYRIARNVVASDYRKQAVRPKIHLSLDQSSFPGDDGSSAKMEVEDGRFEPQAAAMGNERRHLLVVAIKEMIPDFREVLVLRDVEKRSYEEIAELIEVPVGTVRSRLHRARMELKAKVGSFFED